MTYFILTFQTDWWGGVLETLEENMMRQKVTDVNCLETFPTAWSWSTSQPTVTELDWFNVISVHHLCSWGKGICVMFLKSSSNSSFKMDYRWKQEGKWLFSYGGIISEEVRKIKTLARSGPFHNKWSCT